MKNAVEWAVFTAAGSQILAEDLPPDIRAACGADVPERAEAAAAVSIGTATLVGKTMAEIEKEAILTALQAAGGNRRKAADRLDIGLRTLQRKLKEYRGEPAGEGDEAEDEDDAGG
jgi:DNA-binding NtrC family response regulator